MCQAECEKAGFKLFSEAWPSVFWSEKERMLLIVYVDDMKLCGPEIGMKRCWDALGKSISLDKPKGGSDGNVHTFLGCTHTKTVVEINGKMVTCMEYDIKGSMRRAVAKYEQAVFDVTKQWPRLYEVQTPFVQEDTKKAPARAPIADEAFVECPCCLRTMPRSMADLAHASGGYAYEAGEKPPTIRESGRRLTTRRSHWQKIAARCR